MKKLLLFLVVLASTTMAFAATLFPSRTDFRDEQIYFVMTTRFYNGDPSNDTQCWDAQNYNVGDPAWRGDFKGLIEKLDYIKALGFTAVWITPVVENASGYDYHGYHARNFSKVDERYESEDVKFQDLITAAHNKGMKIILDIVLNHTGNFGEEHLCKLFTRDWDADQSNIDACMIPYTKKDGGVLPDNYLTIPGGEQYAKRLAAMKNTDGQNHDENNYWHHYSHFNWDDDSRWWGQIAGDCVDLNTENQYVANYLVKCYGEFIKMGVDGFRIDTGGHISRLTFNKNFIPQFEALAEEHKAARNDGDFFMFAEVCARDRNVTYRNHDNLSPYFYTWKEKKNYAWDTSETSWNGKFVKEGEKGNHTNVTSVNQHAADNDGQYSDGRTSQNALLSGNNYHTPDYSQNSGLSIIDFPMHWNFRSAGEAFGVKYGDKYYNDATWNVTYVDSHDYAPDGAPEGQRFSQSQDTWAENLALMFTFRGIPCVYYGSEIEFKKGCVIDKGPNVALKETGRAYYGGYIKGSAEVTDFAEYENATGNMAQTLKHPLALHIQRLAKIRMAVPALRKGQYSTDGCSGTFAFKRRYTDATTDSYALITISGGATFSNILNGTYKDCVTGDVKTVTNNKLSVSCSGKGNLRVYVLDSQKTLAPGKVGVDGKYIYGSSSVGSSSNWDGTQEELDDRFGQGGNSGSTDWGEPVDPCVASATERAVFFKGDKEWGTSVAVYIWSNKGKNAGWPGQRAEHLGGGTFKYVIPESVDVSGSDCQIIWNNNGNGKQTGDLKFHMRGLYNKTGYQSLVTKLCEGGDTGETPSTPEIPDTPDTPDNPEESDFCVDSDKDRVVFYQAPSNFGNNASVYMWVKGTETALVGAWPGASATHLGNGKFKFTIPSNVTGDESKWMIIWNNNNNGVQTGDLDFHMRGLYDNGGYKGLVTTLCEGGDTGETPDTPDNPDAPDTPAEGITVKAKVPANWGSTISAWVWGDGMDSHWANVTKEGQWYVVTENTTKMNIIFVNGDNWNGDANQTVDMEGITENTCFQLNQSGGGKVQYTIVDCEGGETPDTPDTPVNSITVKAKVPAHWTSTISAWVWADGAEGEWATITKEGEWYVVSKDVNKLNVVFVNADKNWNAGNPNQTENLSFTENACIQITQSGDAKATYTLVECGGNTATKVEDVESNQTQARKILYNGALYLIMPNGDIYNAAGVLVNK